MQDPNQLHTISKNPAGYRPLIPVDLAKGLGNSALFSVAAAASVGLLVGVGFAFSAPHSKSAAPPRLSEAPAIHDSEASPVTPVYAATTTSLLNQVESQKKTAATAPQSLLAGKRSTGKATAAHKQSRVHKLWN